ncbi:MAG: hypothetical protein NC937_03255 [Candidatus Omnitrophica bacterium]|nr:hypothetical protein [Candidatus Omnitrophota bacterium]
MNRITIAITTPLILTILLSIFYGCRREIPRSVEAVDEKMLQEAIDYGKSKAGITYYEFTEPWSVYLGYEVGKGRAVYLSPFLQAAQLAKNAAEKGIQPDINVIKKVVAAKMDTLCFLITTYADEPDAPRRTRVSLIYNNMRIEPVYSHFPPYAEFSRDYYQQINGEVRFPTKNVPRNAVVKLCIEISSKKEKTDKQHDHHHESVIVVGKVYPEKILTEFIFDLSKYR